MYIKKVFKGTLFLAIFIMIFVAVTYVFQDKTCAEEYRTFYDEDVDYDVYIIGTSVARGGVSPLDLWHEYGIVSYNLAMSGQPLALNYYNLKSAIETDKPEVVIADVSYIFLEDQMAAQERTHQFIDNMPMGLNKIEAIVNLVEPADWGEYLFSISFYHERWKELTAKDFTPIESLNRGCTLSSFAREADGSLLDTAEKFAQPLPIIPKDEKKEIPVMAQEYIEKIINLCIEEEIKLVFVAFPAYAYGEVNHGNGTELQMMWNEFADLAKEYEVDYINYMHDFERISFDPKEDLTDWRHLSFTGAEKVTKDLGAFLVENHNLVDRRADVDLQNWNKDYDALVKLKESLLKVKLQAKEAD